MLVTFLFWNTFKRPLESRVARMAATHSIDVIMLAECESDPNEVLKAINGLGEGGYHFPDSFSRKIKIFTRLPAVSLTDQFDDLSHRLTIRRLRLPATQDVLLGVVHLVGKADFSDEEQAELAVDVSAEINRVEDETQIRRTILVGDFNMNPFDKGMISALGFHATMTKQQAGKKERTVQRRKYRYFYNPMWGHFGDKTLGPAGTYYLRSSRLHQYFWNMYDQVLLRPALMDNLVRLEILTSDGVETLVTPGRTPRQRNGSDHLPLLFRLEV